MSAYTCLPLDTVDGALAYVDLFIADPEHGYEDPEVFAALMTLAALVRRLRSELSPAND